MDKSEKLKKLECEREAIRLQVMELTEAIKDQRRTDSQDRKSQQKEVPTGAIGGKKYQELQRENGELRRAMSVLLKNTNETTYKRLGVDLGVSSTRARQIYMRQLRNMRADMYLNDT